MLLDGDGPAGERQHLVIGEGELGAFVGLGAQPFGGLGTALGIDELFLLGAQGTLDDGRQGVVVHQRLEDHVFVRISDALHHRFTQAPGTGDEHHVRKAGLGVDGEHNARGPAVGPHHALHADGQSHLEMVEAVIVAVGDGAVGEQGCVTLAHMVDERVAATDVEIALLLAGEACLRQIFRRGGGADSDIRRALAFAGAKVPIGVGNELCEGCRHLCLEEGLADGLADICQVGIAFRERIRLLTDDRVEAVFGDEAAIGIRRGGEAAGDVHAHGGEIGDHLAQGRVLAADARDILHAGILEPEDHVPFGQRGIGFFGGALGCGHVRLLRQAGCGMVSGHQS